MSRFSGIKILDELYRDDDIVWLRAQTESTQKSHLVKATVSKHPSAELLAYWANELRLASFLESSWAIVPINLQHTREGSLLICHDTKGEPLKAQSFPFEVLRFLRFAHSATFALSKLHKNGIVHLDIKPQNFFIHEQPTSTEVWISGFSIAKTMEEISAWDADARIQGTISYMAPEQTGKLDVNVDFRTDLYSLGITFYQTLTGILPGSRNETLEGVLSQLAIVPSPPEKIVPEIPKTISNIVMKLLAKSAAARYQSTEALLYDLDKCLSDFLKTGGIRAFVLGERDTDAILNIGEVLYGRENEKQYLVAALNRVTQSGNSELVLVSGAPGVGKTALISEFGKEAVSLRKGIFFTGKFEQYKIAAPYFGIIPVLKEVVEYLLTENRNDTAQWKSKIQAALGINGQALANVVPEIVELIGRQPALPYLSENESRNRFALVVQQFFTVVAEHELPLVLFFDDLQWADTSSLSLIEAIVSCSDLHHVLFIGSHRTNEIHSNSPLALMIEHLRLKNLHKTEISIGPLSLIDLNQLTAMSLKTEPNFTTPLTQLIFDKTSGNPFYFVEALKELYRSGVIHFSQEERMWKWDIARVAQHVYTGSVVDFFIQKLRAQSTKLQRTMQMFSAVGSSLKKSQLLTIAPACELTPEDLNIQLTKAKDLGFIFEYENIVTFAHDRVQQAAYSLLDDIERTALHLRIGQHLLKLLPQTPEPNDVFAVVEQLNHCIGALEISSERKKVAELNLLAAQKAMITAAHSVAAVYLEFAEELLSHADWQKDDALAFNIQLERLRCDWLLGNLKEAEARGLEIIKQKRLANKSQALIHRLLIEVYTSKGEMTKAIQQCQACLASFRVSLSTNPTRDEVSSEFLEIQNVLEHRSVESLIHLPEVTDEGIRLSMDAMAATIPAAIFTSENFFSMLCIRMVLLSIQQGNGQSSPSGYVYFGMILGPRFGRYQTGYQFGKLAFELVQKGLTLWKSRVLFMFGNVINFWTQPMRTNFEYLNLAFAAANQLGDISGACYSFNHRISLQLAAGYSLSQTLTLSEQGIAFAHNAGYADIVKIIRSQQLFILSMQGRTLSLGSFKIQDQNEQEFEESIKQSQMALLPFWYYVQRQKAEVFACEYETACATGHIAESMAWSSPGHLEVAEFYFYYGLAIASSLASTSANLINTPDDKYFFLQKMERLQNIVDTLKDWSQNCPENFGHRYALLNAEKSRIDGNNLDAEKLYEKAIQGAHIQQFLQDEALFYERAAMFYEGCGLQTIAQHYFQEAYDHYFSWEAWGKARQLEQKHRHVKIPQTPLPESGKAERTVSLPTRELDYLTLIRALHAISSETVYGKLISAILTALAECGGATDVFILFPTASGYRIGAKGVLKSNAVIVSELPPPDSDACLIDSIVLKSIQSREVQIIDDIANAGFAVGQGGEVCQGSVLCMPVVRQGEVFAILYLQNQSLVKAFSQRQVDLLNLLSIQAAISLENASLYRTLQDSESQLAKQVTTRTAQLETINAELEAFTYSVSHDLRAPLRAIEGFSKIFLEDYGDSISHEGQRILGIVRSNAKLMDDLIKGLLSLSRAGKSEIEFVRIDTRALVMEVCQSLETERSQADVEICLESLPDIFGDRNLLRQVWFNLISNAIKFTSKSSTRKIVIGSQTSDQSPIFFVRDSGSGFDTAYSEKLFVAFQRLHGPEEFEGCGIGLTIVKRIIERHGGRVWAEGAIQGGATFFFSIPARDEMLQRSAAP
jgi:predicted ATPase/signal transduction histidine kinase